jgi:hypothetical protein
MRSDNRLSGVLGWMLVVSGSLLLGCPQAPSPVSPPPVPQPVASNDVQPAADPAAAAGEGQAGQDSSQPPSNPDGGTGSPPNEEAASPPSETAASGAGPTEPAAAPVEGEAASQPNEAPSEPVVEVPKERLLLLTYGGPLIVDAAILIDGGPYRDARGRLIAKIMASADADKNGELSWDEALQNQRFRVGGAMNRSTAMTPSERERQLRQNDKNQNGIVEPQEAERFLARTGGGGSAFAVTNNSEGQGESELLRLLDVDDDRVLSADEVSQTARRLRTRDADDDEVVTRAELIATSAMQAPGMAGSAYNRGQQPVIWITSSPNWRQIHYELKERYQVDGRLAADSFPQFPALGSTLDADKDGEITGTELTAMATTPPHVVIEVRLGRVEEGTRSLAVISVADELSTVRLVEADDARTAWLDLPEGRIQWIAASVGDVPDYTAQAEAQITQIDKDKNGYLEESEAGEQIQQFGGTFEAVDTDGDGKLYPAEYADYLERQQAPERTRVRCQVAQIEHALFSSFDASNDDRLGGRELAQAHERLLALDGNQDGQVTTNEIPARLNLSFSLGNTVDPTAIQLYRPPVAGAPTGGPTWFARSDTNGDGDLSPREFLGTAEQFSEIDLNADGLLDAAEAQKATPEPPADAATAAGED